MKGVTETYIVIFLLILICLPSLTVAHRSGCHRWHSCPSDSGSYICGDIGYCSYCPDNQFCKDGKPRSTIKQHNEDYSSQSKEESKKSYRTLDEIKEYRQVVRVIDGDTIELDGGEKVRLIGVDTPETVHPNKPVEYFGKEASKFTKNMVEGKFLKLEYDWQRTDKYGRMLAYVYLLDGTFVNAEIIKQGYGFAYTKYPFKYLEKFREYERQARENHRGLWAQKTML